MEVAMMGGVDFGLGWVGERTGIEGIAMTTEVEGEPWRLTSRGGDGDVMLYLSPIGQWQRRWRVVMEVAMMGGADFGLGSRLGSRFRIDASLNPDLWLFPIGREVDGNTTTAAVAAHTAEAGQGGAHFVNPLEYMEEDNNYMNYVDTMLPVQTGRNRARAFPLETRIQATMKEWPDASTNNNPIPFESIRQTLFNSYDSKTVFVGMVEGADNDWYDSIAHDAQMMEQMEDPGINAIASPLQLPRSQAPDQEPTAKEPNLKLSISKIWGLHPSELDPDGPGPSTRAQSRVAPLADDEVAKFDCGICLETLPIFDLFHGMSCTHKFCVVCMEKYIKGRTRAGEVPIPCPDPSCMEEGNDTILNPEDCKKSIDFDVFCAWTNLLTENAIPPNQRVYCPNRECGIMLEMVESTCTNKTPSKVPCPVCNHLMCASCRMDWSSDGSGQHDCTEGPDAELMKQLAAQHQWKKCPRCRYYVERTTGCDVMTCRILVTDMYQMVDK
ncbi:hypothetical protein HU200_059958 [Digitaria exilis]|uniref:RBR-type E3 ubiquitin transferase n=1 Tax=Digitaria exilis TaxID=1010633 RepID=A0A835DZH9_9POAL|nr:hypothetical protein HU200_059958 [Digitaria exilis]